MACTYGTLGHLGRDPGLVASLHTLKHLVLQEWGGPSLDHMKLWTDTSSQRMVVAPLEF